MSIPPGYVSNKKALEFFSISQGTIINWRKAGKIRFIRPARNYYYDIRGLSETLDPRTNYIYARVSTRGQQDNLITQLKYLNDRYPNYKSVTDIGSGLNFKRKGLLAILEQASKGKVGEVVVAYKDRLCRFGFDLVKWLIEKEGGKVVVLNNKVNSPNEELTEDLLSIITVFSNRINGLRSYKTKIEKDKSIPNFESEENIK